MKRCCLLLAASGLLHAQTIENWYALDARLLAKGRWTGDAHTQLRMRARSTDFFYARFGPIFRYRHTDRTTLTAGYYFGNFERGTELWGNNHRSFGAYERVFTAGGGTVSLRTMAEHHFGGVNPPELRIRQAVTLNKPIGHYVLFATTESFTDTHGYMQQRFQSGVRVPLALGYGIDIMYLFDARKARVGEDRHVIQTAIRPRRRPTH